MTDRVHFIWRLRQEATEPDAKELVTELEKDPISAVSILDADAAFTGDLAAIVISGIASASYLAAQIDNIVCRYRKVGIIIDARTDPLRIAENPGLPGGTVITVAANGAQHAYDACATGFDLAEVISALRSVE